MPTPSGTNDQATWLDVWVAFLMPYRSIVGTMNTLVSMNPAVTRCVLEAPSHLETASMALLIGAIIPAAFANAPNTKTSMSAV